MARILVVLILAAGACATAAQAEAPAVPRASPVSSTADSGFGVLIGRWVRPDGGYVIAIKGVDANGKLDAAYANPNPLPFARAEAARDGKTIKLFFELTAGGYGGSTYTLTYEPADDVLRGVYYQAVARQRFDVQFARIR